MIDIKRVVILGANGTMGAGSAETFAAGGCDVVLLARATERAREGLVGAQNMAKSVRIADRMSVGTYDGDFDEAVGKADLIFEALAEDIELKKGFFERVDKIRRPESIVATVSSGLSITEMARPRSDGFKRNFLGIHLFNPPNVIVGTEVIPHAGTDPALVPATVDLLEKRFGRVVTVCRDQPAFAGNRVGFKVLNEVAQLAAKHGVAFADYLIGPYTGRAMSPLATIDLVGWDVHKAIVDNVHANTNDEAHDAFALPTYMAELVDEGHLGNKTPERGGFYRRTKEGGKTINLVLDPNSGGYKDPADVKVKPLPFVEKMRELHRIGCYADAFKHFLAATGAEADLARTVVFGYVSYALNRVGASEVVDQPRDVDRIMGFGFNWAPPTVLVDVIGIKETIKAIEQCGLKVPAVLAKAKPGERLFREPNVNPGRFFAA
ncbi:MAG TPA: 3-hydroxyacyl-CoA dehydrogenase family protein [Candidatus Binatia bacterium]|nr:3-hydroxyacyl-CoA dehydrogenase family protein [Candidatus Binatia bacterium]